MNPAPPAKTAEALRREFDASFARTPAAEAEAAEDLLALRVAGAPYAIRVREIRGVAAARKVVPLPTRLPELLGLTGMRGELIPVYSLAALLGYARDAGPPRWLAFGGGRGLVALAFDAVDGHLRVSPSDLHAAAETGPGRAHVPEIVRIGAEARPLIRVSSVLEDLSQRIGRAQPAQEG